ncbi:portal protein [Camelimonas fluminis]|uniref:Portal protein n=1 Tax=Camelimonas fluminis TaxID=1576911 RepID=A0ABV7UNE9_9HYPH|nr:portal protein [Camelimonas fluminis]GHE74740.1 portal protein [Camelimonas fluminis]
MADEQKSTAKDDDGDFLRLAHERYNSGYERERDNIRESYYDLEFHNGLNQWEDEARRVREGRPCITVNALPTYTRQITGDMRQMRPSIKCVGVDDNSDPDTAEALSAVIRYIENRSKAQSAVYSMAADSQVVCGIAHWRVMTEYASDTTFDQDIRLALVDDGVSVIWDPDASDLARSDARFCFVPVDMSTAAFKDRYPGKSVSGWTTNYAYDAGMWASDDHVRVAEYWFKKSVKHRLLLLKSGSVYDLDDPDEDRAAENAKIAEEAGARGEIARQEQRTVDEVWRAVISCGEILEGPERHVGRHIPIVPVIGNEMTIQRKRVRYGSIRFARDPQRLYNYGRSAQIELTALQPKAPYIGTEKNFEENEGLWQQANNANLPYLAYTPDPANGGSMPSRQPPPQPSVALTQEIALAAEDIKRTIGIYDAGLGAQSNETSGKAILARQREGDVGAFVYVDHFTYAIQRTGEILVDLIPRIYDTARTLRIAGEDGTIEELAINQPNGVAVEGAAPIMNDLTVGSYDVVMSMGPSYTTRREEAREGMRELVQSAPDLFPAIGDLYVQAQDWPMADKMAERLRLLAPPQIQQQIAKESDEPPEPPPQPSPQEQQAIQMQMVSAEAETRQKVAQAAKAEADAQKAQIDLAKAEMELQMAGMPQPVAPQHQQRPAEDPRVDQVIGAVQELQAVVGDLFQMIQATPAPPEMQMEPPPDVGPPADMELPQEPPQGGFFVGPDEAGQPPV